MYPDFTCTSLWVKWLKKLVISIKRPRTDFWLISKVSPSTTTGASVFPMATILQEKAGALWFLEAVSLRPMFHEKPASCLHAMLLKTAVAQAVKVLPQAHRHRGSQQKDIATALFGKLYANRVQAVTHSKIFRGSSCPFQVWHLYHQYRDPGLLNWTQKTFLLLTSMLFGWQAL